MHFVSALNVIRCLGLCVYCSLACAYVRGFAHVANAACVQQQQQLFFFLPPHPTPPSLAPVPGSMAERD